MADGWRDRMASSTPSTTEQLDTKAVASTSQLAEPEPQQSHVLVDEKEQRSDPAASFGTEPTNTTSRASAMSLSPPTSPPVSPPAMENRKGSRSTAEDYYTSRPRHDKLGNVIPDRHRPGGGAMASVYGRKAVTLPGDLGAKDPRRPRSPAPPASLPGDLGPNDPRKPRSTHSSPAPVSHTSHGSLDGSEGGARLQEDPPVPGADTQDSDEDADADNDNDMDPDAKRGRGRKRPEPGKTTSGKSTNLREGSVDSEAEFPDAKPDPTKGESKLSFQSTESSTKVMPHIEKKRVHPSTAFDVGGGYSGNSTPIGGSDDESQSELRAAQKLSLTMSAIHSTPSAHRVIRQIVRGDYAHFQREAELGRKRQRMYLVATDLSPESEYALEWTIGTVLRDGDTLFAVFANDEEPASSGEKSGGGVEIGHGADSVRDTSAIISGLPSANVPAVPAAGPSPLARGAPTDGRSRSRGVYSSADLERRRAAEDITQRCIALLRKTRLQVRVVVEVFHCKSPRHMITEVIDFLSPTLVIIGSRGRSAVKGVLLGSFSNYLVTKSSVPVMVARKKLRKHGKGDLKAKTNRDGTSVPYSGSGRTGRMSNIIESPRGKGLRVKGWGEVGID